MIFIYYLFIIFVKILHAITLILYNPLNYCVNTIYTQDAQIELKKYTNILILIIYLFFSM